MEIVNRRIKYVPADTVQPIFPQQLKTFSCCKEMIEPIYGFYIQVIIDEILEAYMGAPLPFASDKVFLGVLWDFPTDYFFICMDGLITEGEPVPVINKRDQVIIIFIFLIFDGIVDILHKR